MKRREFILFVNIAGSLSSILALLLTLSQKNTFAYVIKLFVAIAFFITAAASLGLGAYKFRKWWIDKSQLPYVALYWLFVGAAIIYLSFYISCFGFFIAESLDYLFTSFIHEIKTGVLTK